MILGSRTGSLLLFFVGGGRAVVGRGGAEGGREGGEGRRRSGERGNTVAEVVVVEVGWGRGEVRTAVIELDFRHGD